MTFPPRSPNCAQRPGLPSPIENISRKWKPNMPSRFPGAGSLLILPKSSSSSMIQSSRATVASPLGQLAYQRRERDRVTALFGASEYDRGAIIHQSAKPVSYPITIAQAITQIDQCYLECANAVLEKIASGEPLIGQAQDDSKATYSLWRDEDDYQIDWSLPAAVVRRTIDALSAPYRGAYCRVNDVPARILGAVEVEDVNIENRHIGKVIFVEAGQPVIVCGEGLIKITACISEDSGEPPAAEKV